MNKSRWKFLVFTLIVLSLSIVSFRPANAAVLDAALTDGLVAYYPFNGNADDESGNGNNGTVFGATLTPDRFGVPNAAYLFNGINDYIEVPHDPALEPTVFSVSLWFKTTTTSLSTIITSDPDGYFCNHGYSVQLNGKISDGKATFGVDPSPGCGDHSTLKSDNPANDGAWHHLVGTYDATNTLHIYIDGVLQTATMVSPYSKGNGPIRIGTRVTSFKVNEWFNGAIDDILIYNRALTPTEVLELFNLVPGAPTIKISPATGSYVFTQALDVTLIISSPFAIMTGATATLDGSDVSTPFLNCAVAGTLISGGETHRCGHVRGSLLGVGSHTFSVTVTLSDGSVLTDTVTWDVLENIEP